jgi:hypothetical protein
MLSLLTLCMYSCSNDSESDLIPVVNDPGGTDNPDETSINYTDDILPIMQSACISCHSSPPTNGAPFSLVNFSQVSQRANSILNSMNKQNGTPGAMPPSGRLPQATLNLVEQWINDGKLEN